MFPLIMLNSQCKQDNGQLRDSTRNNDNLQTGYKMECMLWGVYVRELQLPNVVKVHPVFFNTAVI